MSRRFEPIAIVGRSCVLPGALDPGALWQAVADGRDLISHAPGERWGIAKDRVLAEHGSPDSDGDHTWTDRGGYVRGFDSIFDPGGFRLPAPEIVGLDPLFQWLLHTGRAALSDASLGDDEARLERTGAVIGNLSFPAAGTHRFAEAVWRGGNGGQPDPRNRFISGLPAHLLARALGLGGPAFALDAACASSLYALKLACDRLHDRRSDVMLAGAVACCDDLFIHIGFTALEALSPSGRSRPFHRRADGLLPAEGAALVVLERLDDAVAAGRPIRGVIRGIGLSNDGRGRGLLVPSPDGQERALRQAYEVAGLSPADVSLIECHATGTQVGDAIELESLGRIYAGPRGESGAIPIGSLKSNLGHLITAAGLAGLLKVLAAMEAGVRPATLHADEPTPAIEDSPFRLLTAPEPWPDDRPRVAAVSAFGFGGNNAHLLVEEPPSRERLSAIAARGQPEERPAAPIAVVGMAVTAADRDGLEGFARTVLEGESRLEQRPDGSLAGAAKPVELRLAGLSFPPRDLDQTLPQQILLLRTAQQAMATVETQLPPERTAVLAGMGCDVEVARWGVRWRLGGGELPLSGEELRRARDGVVPELRPEGVMGTMPNMVANRLNRQLGLGGASASISSEERSGVVALELAERALAAGEIDAALVAAVDLSCEPAHEVAASLLLPESRHFPGDAAVVLVLKRLEDARRDGDRVLAILDPGLAGDESGLRFALDAEPGSISLTPLVGHAHAASGLLHVAAAVLACHHRARPVTEPAPRKRRLASPWLASGRRRAEVAIEALGGQRSTVLVSEDRDAEPGSLAPSAGFPQIFRVSGKDRAVVSSRLRQGDWDVPGEPFGDRPARLTLVATDRRQLEERCQRAVRLLNSEERGRISGVFYRDRPLAGELAFTFSGAAAAYRGMGRELLLALPELLDALGRRMSDMRLAAGWVYDQEPSPEPLTPLDKLWGSSFLCQVHGELSQRLLGLRPAATLGYSSGESNALLALGAWQDLDGLYRDTRDGGLFHIELGGELRAVARAWGDDGKWSSWVLKAPPEQVRDAIAGERRVHLTHVNHPGEVVIGGDQESCRRLIGQLGADAVALDFELAVHCPEVSEVAEAWLELHRRPTREMDDVRFYTCDGIRSYHPTREDAAKAILGQALTTVDFPALVRRAWDDGVRIFVEHGPRDLLSEWTRETLRQHGVGDDEYLAVAFDRAGSCSCEQAALAVARLAAAGVEVDSRCFADRWSEESGDEIAVPSVTLAAHWPPVPSGARSVSLAELLEDEMTETEDGPAQIMAPAPALVPVLGDHPSPSSGPPQATRSTPAREDATAFPTAAVTEAQVGGVAVHQAPTGTLALPSPAAVADLHARLAEAQQEFLRGQTEIHQRFLSWRRREQQHLLRIARRYRSGENVPEAPPATSRPSAAPSPRSPAAAPRPVESPPVQEAAAEELPGPKWNRDELEVLARGKISEVFGPLFARQDGYRRQVRMPTGTFLLADRVTGLDGEPGSMGLGTIWTETDVRQDSWFLHRRHMMPGLMIEAGQADLLLISWLGIDFLNRGDRVYRLLGCELTYRGALPRPGDTLRYEIHVDGHADQGDVRLFFFHYDCHLAGSGEKRLEVRSGQAGFFTDKELAESAGILWDGAVVEPVGDRLAPPAVACTRHSFTRQQLEAAAEGRVLECLGPGFELAASHTLTPTLRSGRLLLFDRVTDFDASGGPWKRGYLRAVADVAPDAWFFDGHFHNDPCMPGTLMFDGCLQTMAFYLMALGFTLERDGWRFEPVPDEAYRMRCRGQVDPSSKELVYELFVHEVIDGPVPTLWADLLCTVDGLKAFHAERVGLRLVPDWPLETQPELAELPFLPAAGDGARVEEGPSSRFAFGYDSLLACAWGRPSRAFGDMYRVFDGPRSVPRLPGPPYHFMSRIATIDGDMGLLQPGAVIEADYEVPAGEWYFDENGCPSMPFAVLMEAGLQPCGWLASFVGSALTSDEDLKFRNLDGTGTLRAEIGRDSGTIRSRVHLTDVSKLAEVIIVRFEVEMRCAGELIFDMKTAFGFFPGAAMEEQAGLPASDEERHRLQAPSDFDVDLTARPQRYCGDGQLRLAGPRLLMLDRVTGYWPEAGKAGLGRLRAEKDVEPGEWFFKAHFFQDPVQPGSLGLEAMVQLLQFYMIHRGLGDGIPNPRFEPLAVECPLTWKYRGQVVPTDGCITTELEIVEVERDPSGAVALADAHLWIDGKRIYSATGLGMRIVAGTEPEQAIEEVLDPARDVWLDDHCPTWTFPALPMMSVVDRLATAALAARPGWVVVAVEDVAMRHWIAFDKGAVRLRTEVLEAVYGDDRWTLSLELRTQAAGGPRAGDPSIGESRFTVAARGRVVLAEGYPPPPPGFAPLQATELADDPYAAGVLFHGPAFQLLRELRFSERGSSSLLDASAGGAPIGTLHQVLLDAATHGIPHDDLRLWLPDAPADVAAYPRRLVEARFFGPTPTAGAVRAEARVAEIAGAAAPGRPAFHIQLQIDGAPWAELLLEEVLLPKGPLGTAPPGDRRAFLRDHQAVPGLTLARRTSGPAGEITRLKVTEVAASDWLPGTVARVYGVSPDADRRTLTREVAVRDHVAQWAGVHPGRMSLEWTAGGEGATGLPEQMPFNRFLVRVTEESGGELAVADAGPSRLDVEPLRRFWRRFLGVGRWPVEDLFVGLVERFFRRVTLADPAAWEAVRGRPLLFLGNHQVMIESLLFSVVSAALSGLPVKTLAEVERRTSWVGQLIDHSFSYPQV
ncbi:MAG: beta-ketoacyl synthase N-terminal-like domain-containing protein, partial [Thermoanaerobaculia bacterium]